MSAAHSNSALSVRAKAFSVSNLIGSPIHSANGTKNCQAIPPTCQLEHSNGFQNANFPTPSQNITAELLCRELWLEFHSIGTEMIITKAGRRMFPSIKVRFSGLEDDTLYIVYIDMEPVDDKRYKYVYQSSKWVPGGPGDVPHQERFFLHPDGPQLGKFWNKQSCIAFDKLKLTNSRKPSQQDQIPLHSMHRYQPKLYVQPISNDVYGAFNSSHEEWKLFCRSSSSTVSFAFPETQFITVTAYQNQQITRLKIASNPFAKGFRDSSREPRTFNLNENNEAPNNKKSRTSSESKRCTTSNFPLIDINGWNSFHNTTLPAIHHWWIQQYTVLHPSIPTESSMPCDQPAGQDCHQLCCLASSPFV